MSKYSKLLFSLFSISTAVVMADQSNMQKQKPMPMQPQGVTTEPQGVITPPFGPRVQNGADVFLTADFIWWKTHLGGMEYAIQGVKDTGLANSLVVGAGTSTSQGRIAQPDFDFQPGFKVGAGLELAHDGWDLFAQWTWLSSENGKTSTEAESGEGLSTALPVYLADASVSNDPAVLFLSEASSKWKQTFNVLDLEMGRNFFISKRLTLRPFFGLKAAWIKETLKCNFEPLPSQVFQDITLSEAEQERKQKMWGIGIRGGLDTVWHFAKNWGAYGNFALTTLWSDFHCTLEDETTTLTGVETENLDTRETITEVIPVLEMELGLTWMTWFHNNDYMLQISAGWEEQVWMNFNHFVDTNRYGNLSTQGLTVKAEFAF